MGNTLHTLEVVVEATNTKYKKTMKDTLQTATKTADSVNGELGKIKNPIAEMLKNDKTMKSIRNLQNLIKKSWTDMFNGTNPKELTKGIKNYVKEAQLAAGIKVYTDDYLQLGKDISDTEKELSKLQEKMSGMDESKRFVPTQEFTDLEKNIKSANSMLDKLYEKKRKMENSGKSMLPTEDYTAYTELIADAESRLEQLIAKQKEWKELGVNENGSSLMQTLINDIRDTEKEISVLKGELKDLEGTGGAFSPTWEYKDLTNEISRTEKKLQEYKDLRKQLIADGSNAKEADAFKKVELAISSAEAKLDSYAAKKRSMESSGQDVQFTGGLANRSSFATAGAVKSKTLASIKEMNARIAETIAKIPGIGKMAANAAYLGSKAFSGMRAVMGKVTSGIKTAGGAFASLIQKFRSGIPSIGRARQSMSGLGNTGKGLGGIFNTLAMSARFMFASFLISGAVNGAKEGLQNLAKYSSATNNSISALMSGLTQLKNSLATAFAPVLDVVAPILSTMIDYLIAASNAVAQFMAALTGKSTYTVAKRVQQDYAASLGGTAAAANGANEAAQDLQRTIMGFDEINKLDDNSSGSSGGGSGGSGGGAGAGDMFETETIENEFADFAQKIKDAWNNADFTEIGSIIGAKLKEGLDDIPWEMIQESAKKVGKSLATLINGFVETSGLADSVGNTVAQALNTGVLGANAFLTDLHWESVGQFVADSMNSFIENADWSGAGEAVKNGINGVFTAAETWSKKFEFGNLGEKVSDAVNAVLDGIEWSTAVSFSEKTGKGIAEALNKVITPKTLGSVGKTFAGVVNTVISGAHSFLGEVEWDNWGIAIGTGINNFFSDVDWEKAGLSFNSAAQGILTTLRKAIKTTDWKKVGEDIADFIKGCNFSELLDGVGDIIWDAINAAIEAWKKLFDADPIETTIVTAILALKFTGLSGVLGKKIWDIIKSEIKGSAPSSDSPSDESTGGIAAGLAALIKSGAQKAGETLGGLSGILGEVFQATGGVSNPLGILFDDEIRDTMIDGWKQFFEDMKPYISDGISDLNDYIEENPLRILPGYGLIEDGVTWAENLKKAFTEWWESTFGGEDGETPEIEVSSLSLVAPIESKVKITGYDFPNETDPLNVDVNATAISFTDKIDETKKQLGGFASTVASFVDDITGGKILTGFVSAFGSFADKISGSRVISDFISTLTGYNDGISAAKSIGGFISKLTNYSDGITVGKVVSGFVSTLTNFSDAIKNKEVKDFIALANDLADNIPVKKKEIEGFKANVSETFTQKGKTLTLSDITGYTKSVEWKSGTKDANKIMEVIARTGGIAFKKGTTDAKKILGVIARTGGIGWKSGTKDGKKKLSVIGKAISAYQGYDDRKRPSVNVNGKATGAYQGYADYNKPSVNVFGKVIDGAKYGGWGISLSGTLTLAGLLMSVLLKKDGGIFSGGSWKPITAYAGGGTPNMGQMFIAREAGPELVGTIGGHTAVMNNNQIVSSVAAGVYQAVAAAMSQSRQNNSGGTPIFNIYVGGKRVTDVVIEEVNHRTQSTGVCPILT